MVLLLAEASAPGTGAPLTRTSALVLKPTCAAPSRTVQGEVCADAAGWHGDRGFVHEALARVLGADLARHEFYFAGPPLMTQAIQELLMGKHLVPYQQIHFDRFF